MSSCWLIVPVLNYSSERVFFNCPDRLQCTEFWPRSDPVCRPATFRPSSSNGSTLCWREALERCWGCCRADGRTGSGHRHPVARRKFGRRRWGLFGRFGWSYLNVTSIFTENNVHWNTLTFLGHCRMRYCYIEKSFSINLCKKKILQFHISISDENVSISDDHSLALACTWLNLKECSLVASTLVFHFGFTMSQQEISNSGMTIFE
jgi:hypothetical protein